MSEQEQPTGLGTLFLEAMFKKYDDISSTIKTSTIPQFKKLVKNVALTLLVVFIGSLVLVAMGTTSEVKILTVLGRLGLIFTGVIFFFVATPIGYVFAGRKYVTFIRSFAIYQLFITLVIWITPMPVSASLLFGLSFAGCLLAFANVLESNPGSVRVITTVFFAGLLAATYFPSFRDKIDYYIIGMNEPSLIQIYTGDLKAGKIKFFLNGQPKVWYLTTPEGTYELFDHSGHHDIYQKKLQPITPEIARKLINDENLISPRNLQRRSAASDQAPIPGAQGTQDSLKKVEKNQLAQKQQLESQEFKSYIDSSITNSSSNIDVSVTIVDENGNIATSVSSAIADIYNKTGRRSNTSLLRSSFVHKSGYQELYEGNSDIIKRLNLSSHTDYLALGKIRYSMRQGALIVGTIICTAFITMSIISANDKKLTKSFSFSVNGNGVTESQAKEDAIQKLADVYYNEHSSF